MKKPYSEEPPVPSTASKAAKIIMRTAAMKRRQRLVSLPHKRRIGSGPPALLSRSRQVTVRQIGDCSVYHVSPRKEPPRYRTLYLHGGAYVRGLYAQHWRFIALLSDALHSDMIVPDYPLAPEHTAAEVMRLMENVYDSLTAEADPQNLLFMGDSAGGGMALALSQLLRRRGKPLPHKLFLFAPWMDVSMTNPDIARIEPLDPLLNVQELIKAGKAYAGSLSVYDPLVSPVYGDLAHLPPTVIFAGTADVLLADCRRAATLAREAGSSVTLIEIPELPHPGVVMPVPERSWIIERIGELL